MGWKYELAISIVALVNAITVYILQRSNRRQYNELARSLRPPPGPGVFDPDEQTPRNAQCVSRQGHVWQLTDHALTWRCAKCGVTFVDRRD